VGEIVGVYAVWVPVPPAVGHDLVHLLWNSGAKGG
jgi:hypothetical protein